MFSRSEPVDWLIVGLGNPGSSYEWTPHNVGFQVVAELSRRWDLGRPRKTFNGLIVSGRVGEPGAPSARVALLQPLTYMNESGTSAGPARGSLKVELDRVIVIHDEIDLPFGQIQARIGGGLAGHNGLKSLRKGFGSEQFGRIRIGVGRPDSTDRKEVSDYVLGRWQQSDAEVEALVADAADLAQRIVLGETSLSGSA
ncbi:MAG: aminoacyl-tRNA hydrolase [Actinobacteria bacterium]|nr:aminoacyl-tRNA hydrolase [Actinomycetota bacterium]